MSGRILCERYHLLNEIGRGGTSRVYLAWDMRLNKLWAVKHVPENKIRNGVLREADILKNLNYPLFPGIVDMFRDSRGAYLILEMIEGATLSCLLEKNGRFDQNLVLEWFTTLAKGLRYLHNREPAIIHRDIKPSNIILSSAGSIRLIDFGIASELRPDICIDRNTLGTKGYAAPEQYEHNGEINGGTDIYSLGVTVYTLLTCTNPAVTRQKVIPVRKYIPDINPYLERIIEKCTCYDREKRYYRAEDLVEDLLDLKKGFGKRGFIYKNCRILNDDIIKSKFNISGKLQKNLQRFAQRAGSNTVKGFRTFGRWVISLRKISYIINKYIAEKPEVFFGKIKGKNIE